MHPYAIDSNEREIVPFYLAAFAIALIWGFYSIMSQYNLALPWWISAPSVLGFYEVLFLLFDHYVWRWGVLRRMGIVKTPIIAGQWAGEVVSSFENAKKEISAEIIQTWTQMEVCLTTDHSHSCSLGAFFAGSPPSGPILTYAYQNIPATGAVPSMHTHSGTVQLLLSKNKMAGDYYSGRDRQNIGSINMIKKE